MKHEAFTVEFKKMDLHGPAFRGACTCDWRSPGAPASEQRALRNAQEHADAKNSEDDNSTSTI